MSRKLVQVVEQYINMVMHEGKDCEGAVTLRARFSDVPGFLQIADIADANIERGAARQPIDDALIPELARATRPVAAEIVEVEPALFDGSWNTNHHIEITLTIAECRAVLQAVAKADDKPIPEVNYRK